MLDIINAEVKLYDEIDSTNSEAILHLDNQSKNYNPIWFKTKSQTNGRGRNKNKWVSDKGNLFASLLIPINFELKIVPMLSCVAAVSVHETVSSFLKNDNSLKIKWPNDIIYENSKLSGILIENQFSGKNKYSIIGIGVNIISSPKNLAYSTISLNDLVSNSDNLLEAFFIKLKQEFHKNLNFFNRNRINYFREYALQNLWNLNEYVSINCSGQIQKGIITNLRDNYELELEINKQIKTFNSGEISIKK